MKLADWLSRNQVSDAEFGRRINRSRQAVHRYKTDERFPERDVLADIYRETDGQVTANDFVGLPPPSEDSADSGESSEPEPVPATG